MKHMDFIISCARSAWSFLTAWCTEDLVSLPRVHHDRRHSSILPAVGRVARSVPRATATPAELHACTGGAAVERQLAAIGSVLNDVHRRLNNVYAAAR